MSMLIDEAIPEMFRWGYRCRTNGFYSGANEDSDVCKHSGDRYKVAIYYDLMFRL